MTISSELQEGCQCVHGRQTEEESPRDSGRERQRKGEDQGEPPVTFPS